MDTPHIPPTSDHVADRKPKPEVDDKTRGRRRSRNKSRDETGDTSPAEGDAEGDGDGDGADGPSSGNDGPTRKRRRSRKGLDKKFECPHDGCGKTYSRAEHL